MKTLLLLLLIPILMQGQTVTEKIKAKFKQINDAKIARLKECEELKFNNAPQESARIGSQGTEYFRKYDLVEATIYNADIPESKDAYLLTLSSIIKLWDSYAKECKADTVITGYSVVFDDSNNEPSLVGKMKPIYGQRTYPTLQGFIEFLRNKLGEK